MTECDWVEVTGRGGVGGEGAVQQTTVTTAAVLQHDHVKCDDDYDVGVLVRKEG